MKINGSNLNEQFLISLKNGLCQKLALDEVKLIYNQTIFESIKEKNEFRIKLNTPTFGIYKFTIKSKQYHIHETKTIKAYSRIFINSLKVSVYNGENKSEVINYTYSTNSKNRLNISLQNGDIVTFVPEIYSYNLEPFLDYSCFSYILLYNHISGSEFIIMKRPFEKQLILNYNAISMNGINFKNYSSTIFEDCEYIYPLESLNFGDIYFSGKEIENYDYHYNEYYVQKEILSHTFRPPMKVPNIIFSLVLSTVPFFFIETYLSKISSLNLNVIKIDDKGLILFKILSIISIVFIFILLLVYWIVLNIFQGLYILGLALGIAIPIIFKFLQNMPFSFEGELKSNFGLEDEKHKKES